MALDRQALKTEIKNILNDLKNETNQDVAIEQYADRLATAIHNYVSSADVNTTVTVTCPSGAGSGTGTGTLS